MSACSRPKRHRHRGRCRRAAQARRRQQPAHRRLTIAISRAAGSSRAQQRCAAPNANDMPWDRRSRVWYLPSDPETSWLDGLRAAAAAPSWPATACRLRGRCRALAAHSARCAVSRICSPTAGRRWPRSRRSRRRTRARGPCGWCITSGRTLSGATRTGKYQHGKKHLPAVGAMIPIVYDRDNSARHSKSRCPLVTIRPSRSLFAFRYSLFAFATVTSHRTSRTSRTRQLGRDLAQEDCECRRDSLACGDELVRRRAEQLTRARRSFGALRRTDDVPNSMPRAVPAGDVAPEADSASRQSTDDRRSETHSRRAAGSRRCKS